MNQACELSRVTKEYLAVYYEILDEMIRGMTEAELNSSISHNFIVQMIPHHRAAIRMSENILRYTTNVDLQRIALGIVEEQTRSIANMQRILCRCTARINSQEEIGRYQWRVDQILRTMFAAMENARVTNDVTCDFMREMIPHHRGAIQMSEFTLQSGICPELYPILTAIIRSQRQGILQMEQLLACCCRCRV